MKKCTECKDRIISNNPGKTPTEVPYIVFENAQARNERKDKRNLILILVLIFALLFSNMAWLWVFNQYDYSSYTVEQDTTDGGNANYIGESGDIINGVSESNSEEKN